MKTRKIQQVEIISEKDENIFKQKVNARLQELESVLETKLMESDGFSILIKYEILKEVPEDVSDVFYLEKHTHYQCFDCPFLRVDPDRRAITHWCSLHRDRVGLKAPCCDEFYQGLLDGTYHLVTHEERMRQYEEMDNIELERRRKHARINQKIYVDKRKAEKISMQKSVVAPRYCYEYIHATDERLRQLENQYLSMQEISFILYGKLVDLSEKKLIELAQETGADVLWKSPSIFDNSAVCIYPGESVTE